MHTQGLDERILPNSAIQRFSIKIHDCVRRREIDRSFCLAAGFQAGSSSATGLINAPPEQEKPCINLCHLLTHMNWTVFMSILSASSLVVIT